jgi:hypothetical protein
MKESFQIPEPYNTKFSVTIMVTVDGIFTCTLPEEIAALFAGKIILNDNRNGRPGYFHNETYTGLKKNIGDKITELCSEEIVDTKKVIQFSIETACSYCIAKDGTFVPWRINEASEWKGGTKQTDATHHLPFSLNIYAMPRNKITYRFKSNGKERVVYTDYRKQDFTSTSEELEKDPCQWLCSLVGNMPMGPVQEMPYTDENARFFVNLHKSLFAVNEKIKPFLSPKGIKQLAQSKGNLMIGGV